MVGLLGPGGLEEQLGRLDHRVGLAAALGVPDEAAPLVGVERAADDRLDSGGLVLAEDDLLDLLVLFGEDDPVVEHAEDLRDRAEALDLGFEVADLLVLPLEDIAADRVPGGAVVEAETSWR